MNRYRPIFLTFSLSPLLYKGVIRAIFVSSRKISWAKELLSIYLVPLYLPSFFNIFFIFCKQFIVIGSFQFFSDCQKQLTGCSFKNLTNFTGKHLCQRFLFNKETLAQAFSCKFGEIFKNTFL